MIRPVSLAEDENGVGAVDGISQQQNAAEEAEIPERLGDDARPRLLGGDPLHEKARRKQEFARRPMNSQTISVLGVTSRQWTEPAQCILLPPTT